MENITTDKLLQIYNSNFEVVYITSNDQIKSTNKDLDFDHMDLKYLFFTSDFETMFNIKEELIKRGETI